MVSQTPESTKPRKPENAPRSHEAELFEGVYCDLGGIAAMVRVTPVAGGFDGNGKPNSPWIRPELKEGQPEISLPQEPSIMTLRNPRDDRIVDVFPRTQEGGDSSVVLVIRPRPDSL